MPLPVAMRIELDRALVDGKGEGGAEEADAQVTLRIAKERRGRISAPVAVSFERGSFERGSFERGSFERGEHREVERAPLVLGDVLEGVRVEGEQMNDVDDVVMQK